MSSNDGIVRRMPLFARIYATIIPTVALILTAAAFGAIVYVHKQLEHVLDPQESSRAYWLVLASIGAAEALGLSMALAAVFFLSRRITRPITAMAAEALSLTTTEAQGSLSADGRICELADLATAFNRLLDEQRRRQAELKELSTNFLHDLKTPLACIRIDAESVLLDGGDPREAMQSICDSCDILRRGIDTNADIVLLASGISRRNPEIVNVTNEASTAVQLYRLAADLKNQTIETFLSTSPILVTAHRLRVQQLVGNLLDNAVKYTPSGGCITLSTARIGDRISISVSDTGVGIPEESIRKIFERFYREQSTRREPGFGLGLALVKSIVDFYGWDIRCDSIVGKGTTFTVTMPEITYTAYGNHI